MARALTQAEAVEELTAHDLWCSVSGLHAPTLESFAAARQWHIATFETGGAKPARRWRATVMARVSERGFVSIAQGYAATEDAALILALGTMLRRLRLQSMSQDMASCDNT